MEGVLMPVPKRVHMSYVGLFPFGAQMWFRCCPRWGLQSSFCRRDAGSSLKQPKTRSLQRALLGSNSTLRLVISTCRRVYSMCNTLEKDPVTLLPLRLFLSACYNIGHMDLRRSAEECGSIM